MQQELPKIQSVGLFYSKKKFSDTSVSLQRKVKKYELEYYFEDGGISVINGKEFPIKRGNLLLAKPGDLRYSHLHFKCKYIHFTTTVPHLISALEAIPSISRITDLKKTEELLSDISACFYSVTPFDNIVAAAKLISLLHFICGNANKELSAVTKAQRFIENNFNENPTTEEIASACNVSVSYLHKLFKNTLDISPGEYLLNCRISAAKDMLINTSLPLSEIAFNCGFNSQSYFSDCFKKSVGVPPKKFRNKTTYLL